MTALASLVTSVPFFPIETPMFASLTAGASLTPSPVIATMFPCDLSPLTMRSLCAGVTLANTLTLGSFCKKLSSSIRSISAPVNTSPPGRRIFSCDAIAQAVSLLSPVIITGRICAVLHFSTASKASFLGGSIIPHRPQNTKFCSAQSDVEFALRQHSASTRIASFAIASFSLKIFCFCIGLMTDTSPFFWQNAHRCNKMSGAPLVNRNISPFLFFTTTDIIFRCESNGISLSTVIPLDENSTPPFAPSTARAASVGSPFTA